MKLTLSLPRALPLMAVALLLTLLPLPGVDAGHGAVGVSPATLDFTNPTLLPGGSKVGYLVFQQHHDRSVQVEIEPVAQRSTAGDATAWITLSHQGTVTLPPGSHQIEVRVDVPLTAPNGMYHAGVRFKVQSESSFEGSGMTAETAVTSIVTVAVDSDKQVKQVEVTGRVSIHNAEVQGDLRFDVHITNTGNVDARPHVRLSVLDQFQARQIDAHWFNETLITPGLVENLTFSVSDHALPEGQYWGEVSVHLDGATIHQSDNQEFDVLEEGALLRSLQLMTIRIEGNVTNVATDKMVKLSAVIINVGQAAATASFTGEVTRDGELVDALQAAPIEVAVGQTHEIHLLYRPTEPGQYEFSGRVHYGSKVTEQKSVLLQVSDEPAATALVYTGVGVLVVCGIGATAAVRWRPGRRRARSDAASGSRRVSRSP